MRELPNFMVTGTPGVGKTSFSEEMAKRFGLIHVQVSRLIQEKQLWEEIDQERDCTIYSDELLDQEVDSIVDSNPKGGIVFDFHASDICRQSDIDYYIILRTETDILYTRLQERNYHEKKIQENVEAEIFNVIGDEVREDIEEDKIIELQSNGPEDMENNLQVVANIIQAFGRLQESKEQL